MKNSIRLTFVFSVLMVFIGQSNAASLTVDPRLINAGHALRTVIYDNRKVIAVGLGIVGAGLTGRYVWKRHQLAQDQARKGAVKPFSSNVLIDGIIKDAQELVEDRDENADRRKSLEMRIATLNQAGGDKPTLKEALEEGIGEWESYRVQLAVCFEESRNIAGSNQAGSLSLDQETRKAVGKMGVAAHEKQTEVSFRLLEWKKQLDNLTGNVTVVAGKNDCDLVLTLEDEADLDNL